MTGPLRLAAQSKPGACVKDAGLVTDKSEIPCRVSSDLHEWRNELGAVSTRGSVKSQSR
jgi:hypothetical protein